jgi:hypothetical protein
MKTKNKNKKTKENWLTDTKPTRTCEKTDQNVLEGSQNQEKTKNLKLLSGRPKRIEGVCVKLKSITTGDD